MLTTRYGASGASSKLGKKSLVQRSRTKKSAPIAINHCHRNLEKYLEVLACAPNIVQLARHLPCLRQLKLLQLGRLDCDVTEPPFEQAHFRASRESAV